MRAQGELEFPATQRFTLQRRLGEGRAGVVFQAIDEENHASVALKVLRRAPPEVLVRVEARFQALWDLRHANLVVLQDFFRPGDERAYFTMELVEGIDVLKYVGGATLAAPRPGAPVAQERTNTAPLLSGGAKRFDEIRVSAAMLGLAKALSALHAKGLMHGELRPGNVRVTPQGRVVLLEAVAAEIGAVLPGPTGSLAPEQARAPSAGSPPRPIGSPADWYAMGSILYEALTGMPPFHGAPSEVLLAKLHKRPQPPVEIAPGIPENLNELCVALLEMQPEARPTDADVMAWLAGRRPRPRAPDPGPAPAPLPARPAVGGAVLGGAAAIQPLAPAAAPAQPPQASPRPPTSPAMPARPAAPAAQVAPHAPAPAPPQPTARSFAGVPGQPPFVGRRAELEALRDALAHIHQGISAVVVSGESGIGKSALVGRFLLEAEKAGALCFSARCYTRLCLPHNAFAGIAGALAAFLLRRGSPLVEQVLPQRVAALAVAFPELLSVPQIQAVVEQHPALGDPPELRHQAVGALLELLARLSQQQPVVLAMDDLHAADPDSLDLLARLLKSQEPGSRILVVGTRRVQPDEPNDPFLAAIGLDESKEVPLGPLPHEEALDLVRRMPLLPGMGPSTTPEGVVRIGQGVPLCLVELLRQPTATGAGRPTPDSLGAAIAAHLAGLDPSSRRLVEVVALAEGPIPLAAAARACAEAPESLEPAEAYPPLVARLRTEGLLEGGEQFVDVAHEQVREAVLARLPEADGPERHRRLASALMEERERGARPGLIGFHLQRAGNEDTAAEALREAADTAASRLAFDLAADLYRRGLKLTGEPLTRRLLQLGMATVLSGAGRIADVADALLAAADGAGPFERLHLRIAAAEHLLSAGQTARALALFADVSPESAPLLKAKASAARRALLAQRLRGGFGWKARRPDEVPLEEALEPEGTRAVGSALWLMDPVRGAALIARAGRKAARLGEPTQVALGMALEACGAAMLGNRRKSRALAEEAPVAAGHAVKDPLLRALLDGYEGIALYYAGNFRAAAEKLALPEEHKDVVALTAWRLGTFRVMRLWALRDAGLHGELIQLVEVWSREAARRKDAFTTAAIGRVGVTAWMARDDPGAALRKLESAKWTAPWPGYLPLEWAETLARANLALYQREGGQLRARFHKPLAAVPGWLLRGSQLARCRTWFLRGRLALMDGSMGGDARTAVAEAAQMARSLEGERVGYASAWALFLRAGVAYQKMDFNRSALRLREAISAADSAGMAHYAVAGRRRLGELIGGEEGASLVRQANEALGRQGVKNPKKLSDALVPGLRT